MNYTFLAGFPFKIGRLLGALLISGLLVPGAESAGQGDGSGEFAAKSGREEWVDLFNGKDLSGWVNVNSAPETWTVKEGMLHCSGFPISALRTERQYENFVLELEWRHLTDGGNSGIFIWASPLAAPGVPFLRGIEVQVLDHGYGQSDWFTTHGDVFPIHGATMVPFPPSHGSRSFPSEERSNASPEWNHYRIECRDGVLRLHVNGKEVSGGSECHYRKGYLALESEGAPVDFRNIRIRELPGSNATADETAPLSEGHRPMFTGTDLRGWRLDEEGVSAVPGDRQEYGPWRVNDWRLVLNEGTGERTLWSDARFGDFEFLIDCNVAAGEVSPVVRVRGGEGNRGIAVPLAAKEGVWERFRLRVEGNRLTILRGEPGVEVDTIELPAEHPWRGRIGLVDVPGAIQFANLYVRDL